MNWKSLIDHKPIKQIEGQVTIHHLAGKLANPEDRLNIAQLVSDYFLKTPDVSIPEQAICFGTSGHRGSARSTSYNELHIQAICMAIVEYRCKAGIDGPLYLGKDTHALSEPAFATALCVLLANGVSVVVQQDLGFTPTPVISRLIIVHNQSQQTKADGLIITPSHNPPMDGGIKYNACHGGPAENEITTIIEQRANELIRENMRSLTSIPYEQALVSPLLHREDFITFYAKELNKVVDMQAIAKARVHIGVDPLGGSGIHYWPVIAQMYNLNLDVMNNELDASFSFMPLDKDGVIRMDCSSPYAMANLITLKDSVDIGIGNDPDFDRHGIVTRSGGLMNPNHYLAVSIYYLMTHRDWPKDSKIGKTIVSSSLIDRVAAHFNHPLAQVPVGFKWFVDGLQDGQYAFAGEESAGASFITRDGQCWTTDKDGFVMGLLAAEMLAVTKSDPKQLYNKLVQILGESCFARIESYASLQQKHILKTVTPSAIKVSALAGENITQILSHAPENNQSIGGIKVSTPNGWFAARPSGTEALYKIYAESFLGQEHLSLILEEAQSIVNTLFDDAGLTSLNC